MTKYEMLYILDNALTDEAKDGIIKKIEDVVVANGGVIEKTDRWGVKKLQYPINYKTEGYYVLVNFKSESAFPLELERVFGINERILRSIVIRHIGDKKTKKEA